MENKAIRCKICFKCGVFMVIHNDNPANQIKLNLFEKIHSGHPTQTVNICEVNKKYTHTDIKIGKEREETLLEIQEMLKAS